MNKKKLLVSLDIFTHVFFVQMVQKILPYKPKNFFFCLELKICSIYLISTQTLDNSFQVN